MRPHCLVLVAALLALAARPALAVPVWLAGSLSTSSFGMDDVNGDVREINAQLKPYGLSMPDVRRGEPRGGAVGAELGSGFTVGVGYERMRARTSVDYATGFITYDLPANLVRVLARYTIRGEGGTGPFVEGSIGRITAAGTLTGSVGGSGTVQGPLSGGAAAFEAGAGFVAFAHRYLAVGAQLGYRWARIDDVHFAGFPIQDVRGGPYSLDYSGVQGRVSLMLFVIE